MQLSCGIATAFGYTIQGKVAEQRELDPAERLAQIGDEIMVAAMVACANPAQVRRCEIGRQK